MRVTFLATVFSLPISAREDDGSETNSSPVSLSET